MSWGGAQHNGSTQTPGMLGARTDPPLACPIFLYSEELGIDSAPEQVLKAPTIRHSFPENQRSQHCRHSRLWRARIRAAELSRKNRTGLQVQASIGLQVPPHFSDRSRNWKVPLERKNDAVSKRSNPKTMGYIKANIIWDK